MEVEPGSQPSDDWKARFAIDRRVVDGVPVLWTETPGPMRAMLVFRVGTVDESPPIRGITHIVEHLAMYPLMQMYGASQRYNATVEPLRTRFMVGGEPAEVVDFLRDVTTNLSSLPTDRLQHELRVLRTEASNREHGSVKGKWIYRFGAHGLGTADYEEFGLRWLGAQAVLDWASRWFTAGNAILCLNRPIPDGLVLNLAPGRRQALPRVKQMPYVTPAVYHVGDRWVALSMLTPRLPAVSPGVRIFDNRLRQLLRHENPIAYNVSAIAERLDQFTAEVTAFADSAQVNSRQAGDVMVAAARGLAESGPSPEDLEAVKSEWRRIRAEPQAPLSQMDAEALAELEGFEAKSIHQMEAEYESITPEDVAHVFEEGLKTAYLALPENVADDLPGFTPIPASTGERVNGVVVTIRPGVARRETINYSDDAISLTYGNGVTVGMRWEEIAVALWWLAGRIRLFGRDGSSILVEPGDWRDPTSLHEQIRRKVPADRWVPMDDPDAPSQPNP